MYIALICVIYLAFISLGLPDSLLGSAWPVMRSEFGASLDFAGVVAMIISGSTIVSSLFAEKVTFRFGTDRVTVFSVALTAAALFGFSISSSLWMLCLWAVPYGLGAGAIDSGLNNYVALHYNSRHMSWLHCFWGVGAAISPYIMAFFLTRGGNWQGGYRTVAVIQACISLVLLLTLPLWKINRKDSSAADGSQPVGIANALKLPGTVWVILAFFAYCTCECTTGLWASSYLVEARGVGKELAARFASLFYLGITFGRFIVGLFSERLGDRKMVRIGVGILFFGITLILIPFSSPVPALAGLVISGFGCAPVFPSIIHATPDNFGAGNSQAVISIEMASAYVGCTFIPPVFGMIAQHFSMKLFPVFLLVFCSLMLFSTEALNRKVDGCRS